MNKKLKIFLLIGIFITASVLRLWQLGLVPPSPDWDEAAFGYNAYSILETGKDEFKKSFPIVLRSFDDYKPALYVYLVIPMIKLFGLSLIAVRFPSAIFGVLTVIATYYLVKELFKREDLALLSSFLLAISPWHIQFSRIAFEANVGLTFNVLTALFFLKSLKRPWLLSLAALCSALSIYSYQSEKIFTPLLIIVMCVIYRKELFKFPKKNLIAAVLVGIIFISPMIYYLLTTKGSFTRAKATFAFSNQAEFLKENTTRLKKDVESNNKIGLVFDNRRVLYAKTGIGGYLSHFDLNWLFIGKDLNRHHAPGMGNLYLWEFPFLLIGIYTLIFNKNYKKQYLKSVAFVFSWFLIAPTPAAFTINVPHGIRTLNFLPTFQIFIAVGILTFIDLLFRTKNKLVGKKLKYLIVFIFLFLFIFNFSYYLNQYFVQQNYFFSKDWQYGYKQAVDEVKKIESKYKKIIVSNKVPLDQSYMFFLFYLKYPPQKYHLESKAISGSFDVDHEFGKYEFRLIEWEKESNAKDTLYVLSPEDFHGNFNYIKSILYFDGSKAIEIGTKQ